MAHQKEQQLAARREATREHAFSLLEDVEHIERTLSQAAKKAENPDIRYLSPILRRWIVEQSVLTIAQPRIGNPLFRVPDMKPAIVAARSAPPIFFNCAGVEVHGAFIRAGRITPGPGSSAKFPDLEGTIDLDLDSFNNQRVVFANGNWITRKDIIQYIANIADGVHSGTAQRPELVAVKKARQHFLLKYDDKNVPSGTLVISYNTKPMVEPPLDISMKYIDCILVELLATAAFFARSPDVVRLIAEIKKEDTA